MIWLVMPEKNLNYPMSSAEEIDCKIKEIFQCTMCGYCCHGESTVSLDKDDQERMIATLGSSREKVAEEFWQVRDNIVQMKTIDGHCIFYKKESGCTIHKGRPWRCGQWPLHPSILHDENNFMTIKESCPGINRELSYKQFCKKLEDIMRLSKNILC